MRISSTEQHHAGSVGWHSLAPVEIAQRFLSAQHDALACLGPALPALTDAAAAVADGLRAGRRVGYAGAGSSGLMALADALELAGTFGIPPAQTPVLFAGGAGALLHMVGAVEDDVTIAQRDFAASGLGPGDRLIAVSASGHTPYTVEIAKAARACGVLVIGFANVAGSALLDLADIAVFLDSGAELVAGSTRLGAATAQKAALNLVSVLAAVRLGHIHDGRMVNLVADNAKLVERAARIVADVAKTGEDAARIALARTGGAVKPAILVARGFTVEAAEHALQQSGGLLGPLLNDP